MGWAVMGGMCVRCMSRRTRIPYAPALRSGMFRVRITEGRSTWHCHHSDTLPPNTENHEAQLQSDVAKSVRRSKVRRSRITLIGNRWREVHVPRAAADYHRLPQMLEKLAQSNANKGLPQAQ